MWELLIWDGWLYVGVLDRDISLVHMACVGHHLSDIQKHYVQLAPSLIHYLATKLPGVYCKRYGKGFGIMCLFLEFPNHSAYNYVPCVNVFLVLFTYLNKIQRHL